MTRTLFLLLLFSHTALSQINLNQGLLAYYPFNGNANDASGNGNNGIPMNGVQLTTDRFGNPNSAYYFDGVSGYISVPNSTNLNPQNAFSIALYFNPARNGTQNLIGKIAYTGGVATQFQMAMDFNLYPGVLFGVNPASNGCTGVPLNASYVNTNSSIVPDQWYCVVGTFDNGIMKIYLDGILIQTINAGFTNLNQCSNADIQIGKWWSGDPLLYQGKIDDIRMYGRALTQDEVTAICSQEAGIGGIINAYTPVLSLNTCNNKINVEDASAFNVGDTVLVIQMKGAVIDTSNTSSFGTVTDYKNSGNYEFNYVKSKTGNIIEFKNVLTRQYDVPNGKVQLVRVPYYQNVNIASTLTCLPWDGSKGGVLVFNVQDTLTLNADIDVSGKGFRGGVPLNSSIVTCNAQLYFYDPLSNNGAQKGESINIISNNINYGRGSSANGGGGGNAHNSGGGGGGNAGQGGQGGDQWDQCKNISENVGGIGGRSLNNNITLNKLFLGGGGGMGHGNDQNEYPAGNGGGIIIVSANSIITNNRIIKADGTNGITCGNSSVCNDGMSAGGAGGAILFNVNNISDSSEIEARGGKGADSYYIHPFVDTSKVGPGGGGGGGYVALKQGSILPGLSIDVSGGINGVVVTQNNNPWGATPGTNGTVLYNLSVPIGSISFKLNIDSVQIKDSATGCRSFNFSGLAYSNTNPISSWLWEFWQWRYH